MSNFLGRLVERAVGPPAAGLSPRLAPVFPLGRAATQMPEPEPFHAETSPDVAAGDRRPERPRPAAVEHGVPPSLASSREQRTTVSPPSSPHEEAPGESVVPIESPPGEPPRTELRTHERTLERSTVRREVEPAEPAEARALAATHVARELVPQVSRSPGSQPRTPRIEVRIGRVEVRRPPLPEPVEWPAPAADPPASAGSGFEALAASRRYVDRRWS